MMAARYGKEDSVKLLLARGADPKRTNDLGQTAADAARSAGRESLARELDRAVTDGVAERRPGLRGEGVSAFD